MLVINGLKLHQYKKLKLQLAFKFLFKIKVKNLYG